ncbi:protein TsetseEP-like isoform X2 [Helianthus annuus]|uniref:protein TsetseEP-like isoform X2 n=1 Tax=Helianthus annuus TaxID=4232 RepID=UPI000B8F251F|nr:protein TsetseEP-like isoform X2 [Helianthus annuus]
MELQVPQVENEPRDVPEDEPQVVPEHEPQILPEDEPQVVPQIEPQFVPENEPQGVPEDEPQVVPHLVPEIEPHENEPPVDEPQVVPQMEPQVVPQNDPQVVPEDEPQVVPVNEHQGFPKYESHWEEISEDDWNEMCEKGKFKKEGMNMTVMDFLIGHELPIVAETKNPATHVFSYRFGRDCTSI